MNAFEYTFANIIGHGEKFNVDNASQQYLLCGIYIKFNFFSVELFEQTL